MPAVELTGVTKTFGEVVAVNDLSLTVPEGSVFGFIGPNGSGKTTTIRMIVNIFYPDRGSVRVLGSEINPSLTRWIGYLPEERGLYRKMKVRPCWSSSANSAAAATSAARWANGWNGWASPTAPTAASTPSARA